MAKKYKVAHNDQMQDEYVLSAGARKVMNDILVPGDVITTDISAGGVAVGKNNLVRIRVAAATFVAFSDDSAIGAVSITTTPAIELPVAGTYLLVATGKYIRASAAAARLEVIQG
jgi:hypothetical protein